MKKPVALLVCLILGTAGLIGCASNDEAFTAKSYTAQIEQVAEIRIDVRDRQIEVTPSPDHQIHIDYFENGKEFYDISVSDDRLLSMTAASNKEWADYIGGKPAAGSRKISLQLPEALLETLNLSTTNEDISLSTWTAAGDISLSSHGGNIVFEKVNVGSSISLDAKNGDISGSILGSYDDYAISCDIKKSESNLPPSKAGGSKTLTVSSNNGDVSVEFV